MPKIIAGLGNPGSKYEKTRHNAGFMLLDTLATSFESDNNWQLNKKFNAELMKEGETILVKPLTFMNNSGTAVRAVMSYYKCLPKNYGLFTAKDKDLSEILTIVHDDIDIALGKYKIGFDQGAAGHRGVLSVFEHLKTKKIVRIRIGIRPEGEMQMPVEKFVLAKFNNEELLALDKVFNDIIKDHIKKQAV
jgi:peptidyl-tRNA hydrolase, PTH1 family